MKRWSQNEIEIVVELLKENKTYNEIGVVLNRTAKSVKEKSSELNIKFTDFIEYDEERKCCECNITFKTKKSDPKKFCNSSCAASFNNRIFIKRKNTEPIKTKCLNCDVEFKKIKKQKYCSYKCQQSHKRKKVFKQIEEGNTSFHSQNYKNYLISKYGEKCMECGWCERNPKSNKIPVELEHIDGDASNNNLKNLKLLCPNCHSLTPTYKALNIGNGRHKRMERYNQGKSF